MLILTNLNSVRYVQMKRYQDSNDSKQQQGETLATTESEYPSRCLSISLREMEEAEAEALKLQTNSQASSDKK